MWFFFNSQDWCPLNYDKPFLDWSLARTDWMKPRLWPQTVCRLVGSFSDGCWRCYSSLLSATNQGWWRNLCHSDTLACLCLQPGKTPPFLLVPFAPSGILSVLSCLGLSVMKNFPALGHAHMLSFCIECRPPIPFTTSECLVESGCKCHFLSVPSNAK